MVSFGGEHTHDGGERCPGCRFKAELAEHLAWASRQGEPDWFVVVGELIPLMAATLAALTRLRAQRLEQDAHDGEELHVEAAAGIARLGGAIEELWAALMADDGDGL